MKKITFELPIYSFHIDFMGHVNNNHYIQWMEIGRNKLMEAVGMPLDKVADDGFVPILVRTEISYLLPLYLGAPVKIEMWLSELRRASALIEFRFYNNSGTLVASSTQKGVFLNTQTQRPLRFTPEMRALFSTYLWEESD